MKALDNAQFHHMRRIDYQAFRCSKKTQQISDSKSQSYINIFYQSIMN
jgi:hypothetical protein